MAGVELQQVDHFPGDVFHRSMLCRPYNHALQNAASGNDGDFPAVVIDQHNDHWEDVPQPVGDVDVAGQDRPARNPSHWHINTAYHGMTDYDQYDPRPLGNPRVFPGVGLAQEVPAPALPNVTVSIDASFLVLPTGCFAAGESRLCYFGPCSPV
ncbi:hypothetical protein BC826DRAFT_1020658 [Russula brevipes]|nr:hypothetical protein BC826DRAFT_1020658 [Russula brevipes]